MKASVGRWQKNKDLFWYTKDKGAPLQPAFKPQFPCDVRKPANCALTLRRLRAGGAGSSVTDEIAAIKAEEDRVRAPL